MNYPTWEVETGHGPAVAFIAVIHTFVAQFAIGGGLFLVVLETLARRRGDAPMLGWLERHSHFFARVSLVLGALTGVGIWFTVGLVNPGGTSVLIRGFVWGWAIEWVFFGVEVVSALVYAYGWKRLAAREHLIVGWIYFGAAWLSLAVINGIITFMLTPGRWLETRAFLDGFFNPTYFPSLVLRTGICVALAGAYALLTGAGEADEALRRRIVRVASAWTLVGLAAAAGAAAWYWSAAVAATALPGGPSHVERVLAGAVPLAGKAARHLPRGVALAAGLALVGIVLPRLVRRPVAVLVLASLLGSLAAFEWVREGVRKPWLVRDYVYVNGVLASEAAVPFSGSLAARSPWVAPGASGEELFRLACRGCHTVDGYLSIRTRVAGRNEAWLTDVLGHLEKMRVAMPPFRAGAGERKVLGAWLAGLTTPVEIAYADADRRSAGERVFGRDCSPCHELAQVTAKLRDVTEEDVSSWLDDIPSMFEGKMPSFHGTPREKAALSAWLAAPEKK